MHVASALHLETMNNKETLEAFEKMLYKTADDLACGLSRNFERLEERIDGAESRLYSRLAEAQDQIEEKIIVY